MSGRLKVSLGVAGVHTMIVLLIASLVASQISEYPESVMLWLPVVFCDRPSSLLLGLADSWWMAGWSDGTRYVYGIAIGLMVCGGVQYFLLSFAICTIVQRWRQAKDDDRATDV